MEPLDLQLWGLRKHCHNSVNRKASKCSSVALPELCFFFRSAPGFSFETSAVLPHWEGLGGYCFLLQQCEKVNEKLPRISLDPGNSHVGLFSALWTLLSQDSYKVLCSLPLFLINTKLGCCFVVVFLKVIADLNFRLTLLCWRSS